jgi:hypothetical protein
MEKVKEKRGLAWFQRHERVYKVSRPDFMGILSRFAALSQVWNSNRDFRPLKYAFVPISHLWVAYLNSSTG